MNDRDNITSGDIDNPMAQSTQSFKMLNMSSLSRPEEEDRVSLSTITTGNLSKSNSNYFLHQQQLKIHPDFHYNKHNESIFDDEKLFPCLPTETNSTNDEVVKFDDSNPDLINCATLRALIVQLTSPEVIDYNLVCDFFLTYRMFSNSNEIMDLLLTRLIWALQYINSNSEPNIRIGKLVLLRTFVVLRHWIINYFVDDFDTNNFICDMFTNTLNKITIESNLIRQDDSQLDQATVTFISKILGDLKIHWLKLIDEFWNLNLDLDSITSNKDQILHYRLPETIELGKQKFPKSSTEMSIHTNPSYRRSAMLSLYDLKTHHKMLIYDNNSSSSSENNPQFSVKNLLMHHQSSRVSINNKLQSIQDGNKARKSGFHLSSSRSKTPPPIANGTDSSEPPVTPTRPSRNCNNNRKPVKSHNYMNIKDSALELKKTKNVQQRPAYQQVDSSNQNQSSVVPEAATTPTRNPKEGFSTNGDIKLPSSKITTIVPPTPAKKMDYVIINDTTSPVTTPQSAKQQLFQPPSRASFAESDNFSTKGSIKRLVDGWKKTIKPAGPNLNESRSTKTLGSTSPHNEGINHLITNAINVMANTSIESRFDILSARIIDELEFLIRHYISSGSNSTANTSTIEENDVVSDSQKEAEKSKEELESHKSMELVDDEPQKQPDLHSVNLNSDVDVNEAIDINDLSELNIKKIDNLINDNDQTPQANGESKDTIVEDAVAAIPNSNDSSFQNAASINWNDDGNLDLENSHSQGRSNIVSGADVADGDDVDKLEDLDDAEEEELDDFNFSINPYRDSRESGGLRSIENTSSISTPSNISQYDVDIADLGIMVSPQRRQSQRVSFTENLSTGYTRRLSRYSANGSMAVRESIKSYVSYDSAFSKSLLKSLDWPAIVPTSTASTNETNSTVSGVQHFAPKSNKRTVVRLSVLCALAELPFSQASPTSEEIPSVSTNNSIFSTTILKNSTNQDHQSTTRKTTASQEESSATTGSTKNSVAIPGISNNVLKELAAIPDESFHFTNPIDFAFLKLEGKSQASSKSTLCGPSPETAQTDFLPAEEQKENEPEEEFHENTEDIINQINHIDTEEAIGLTTYDISQQEEPLSVGTNASNQAAADPLTPIGSRELRELADEDSDPVTSTPNHDNTITNFTQPLSGIGRSSPRYETPQKLLEAYHPSSHILAIENIMYDGSHISFILSYDSKSLAEHLTIIEKDMIQEIDWKDLIEMKWERDLTPATSWLEMIVNDVYFSSNRSVNLVIARFNLMVNWIISEIVLSINEQERINIISRFIHVAQNCYTLQNYSTLMQIILALTGEKVQKLRNTWRNLPPGDILMLKNLEDMCSPVKNFINLRLLINQMTPSKGCIPFVGLYLSDLTFNAERPSIIKKEGSNILFGTEDYILMDEDLINFSKFRTAVHIVKSLSQCIEWSSSYKFKIQPELLSKCLYIKSLDEDEMNYCLSYLD
ncbi:LTE1 [[Candida] subhashii]|uniref:LTE1 n=1 Tax=[Candida] subhashii TaxID=561895 RepID=A0A8J5UU80_9ASCO|nr:LTE1 [[Candida] subhashii]KAG7661475.1 LTE1 [[Candida] subhashii]